VLEVIARLETGERLVAEEGSEDQDANQNRQVRKGLPWEPPLMTFLLQNEIVVP
jgi:hypothetical protein